ncbi:MAG: hypothetical protein JW751_21010 [Polyangiaceae bacterium]|nr:hypothetical protein [Polyangiaceae bacterium]
MFLHSIARTGLSVLLLPIAAGAQPAPPQPIPPSPAAPPLEPTRIEPPLPEPPLPGGAETPPDSPDAELGGDGSPPTPNPERERELEQRLHEVEAKLEALGQQIESDSLERLVAEAENEARGGNEEPPPDRREFLAGSLALQKLNPEITLCGDILAGLVIDGGRFYAGESDRSGFGLRGAGLHLQHMLDPYSLFKSAFHFSPSHGVGVEELYVSWFGVAPSTSVTLGRFRQNFGILNRWHEHDLDQSSYPLALRLVLGDEGLVGQGIMVKWLMPPLWAHANELTVEVVDGSNETLFSGEHFTVPSSMVHLKSYYDLSSSTYLELGLTGMFGFNNHRGVAAEDGRLWDEPWRRTVATGSDLTVYWSPLDRAKYQSFTWRSEFYYVAKELPEDSRQLGSNSWGVYSYLQRQLATQWFAGVRGDVALPTLRDSDELTWDIVPYLTFWQSEFVYFRLEYQHARYLPYSAREDTLERRTDNRALLQVDFAAGPHKHEKY